MELVAEGTERTTAATDAVLAVAAVVAALDEIATPIEELPDPEPLPDEALAQ